MTTKQSEERTEAHLGMRRPDKKTVTGKMIAKIEAMNKEATPEQMLKAISQEAKIIKLKDTIRGANDRMLAIKRRLAIAENARARSLEELKKIDISAAIDLVLELPRE